MFTVKSVLPKVSNFLFKLYSSGAKGAKNVSTPVAGSSGASAQKGGGCKKKGNKGKKGKMCGKPKPPPTPPSKPGPPGGNIIDKCDMFEPHKSDVKKWRLISYCLVPLAFGFSAFVLATAGEHSEPEYIPYEYMYIRSKRFAWRDGRTSLFHGPNNLIPDEEEERIEREQEMEKAHDPKKGEPAPNKTSTVKYKTRENKQEEKLKKRDQHAEEELERRKQRHAQEAST